MGYYSIRNYIVTNNFRYGTLRSCMPYPVTSKYRIRAIRHRSYYLFYHAILCSFYSRVAANREWRLLNSVVWIKVFCKYKGFEKSQFYKINEEFRRGDTVLKQNFQISLDQSFLSYKVVPTWHLHQYIEEDEDELQENELALEDY